jgi:hypothetical protein
MAKNHYSTSPSAAIARVNAATRGASPQTWPRSGNWKEVRLPRSKSSTGGDPGPRTRLTGGWTSESGDRQP